VKIGNRFSENVYKIIELVPVTLGFTLASVSWATCTRHRAAVRTGATDLQSNVDGRQSGTDVMIFKNIFAEKFGKKLAFLTQNKAKLCKILIITLVFEKSAKFFAENCQKSQKIVIITSTPQV
jgi:hypothetical protein